MTRRGSRFRISAQEAAFIDSALQAEQATVRKQALQRLSELYRAGGVLTAVRGLKALVLQLLTDPDSKVQRWAFNALAQIGEAADVSLITHPWRLSRDTPEVFEAGLTALAHLLPKDQLLAELGRSEVELSPGVLMALGQQSSSFAQELADVRLDIDIASAAELRAATLLIGLRKAPGTLFSGRFPVSDVIGELNTHGDPIVAQYSFWAAVEDPSLSLENMRVKPEDFDKLPGNVQGWAYRVLTKDGRQAKAHYETIVRGSENGQVEVREGIAVGIRDIYYDSLDDTVADWYLTEKDPLVRDRLLEHMAAHSDKSSFYREEVVAAYRAAATRSVLRSRLEAANRDRSISFELRKIALQTGDPDFFQSLVTPMTNTMNFNGPITAAGISNSGPGNTGNVQIMSYAEAQARVLPILGELQSELEKLPAAPTADAKNEVAAVAQATNEAIDKPNKDTVGRLASLLKGIKEVAKPF